MNLVWQLVRQFENEILEGNAGLGDNEWFPTSTELMAKYNISLRTAQSAKRILHARGMLEEIPGIGLRMTEGCLHAVLINRRQEFKYELKALLKEDAHLLVITRAEIQSNVG